MSHLILWHLFTYTLIAYHILLLKIEWWQKQGGKLSSKVLSVYGRGSMLADRGTWVNPKLRVSPVKMQGRRGPTHEQTWPWPEVPRELSG